MTTALSADLSFILRRSIVMGGVILLASALVACGDDDDGGTGPSASCIDEFDFTGAPFGEDDVQTIAAGASRSGSITTSDVEIDLGELGVFYYDFYAVAGDADGEVTIEVDPTGTLDVDVIVNDVDLEELAYANDGGDGETESVVVDFEEGACYLVGVSTSEPEATGSYTLSVD